MAALPTSPYDPSAAAEQRQQQPLSFRRHSPLASNMLGNSSAHIQQLDEGFSEDSDAMYTPTETPTELPDAEALDDDKANTLLHQLLGLPAEQRECKYCTPLLVSHHASGY